ncbi:endothelin-converting enzyme homolog [Trichonephila clavipes]|uniref:Endothelin-converting enzyme homolog n=1 Tax=Trichonephila clavipes TaxID=2585209 RepID=A0A8X6UZC3_TRICX|nr:endothelin-converting enzyme homolog [Trichonephila clavipes]
MFLFPENEDFTLMGEAEKKARTFYKSCMNQTRIEERGAEPLLDLLKKTGGWTISGDFDVQDWNFQRMLEVQHNEYGGTAFFSWILEPDLKNSTRNTITIYEPYLTLHTRDNYLNETKDEEVRRRMQSKGRARLDVRLKGQSLQAAVDYLPASSTARYCSRVMKNHISGCSPKSSCA